mmetsp:Transcript_89919/g.251399  ORF Transcript_89919/g.251399 Transcript_89919/m.251399 type:complete len:295 (+) Transcript_89919:415-1299(+)
MCRPWKRYFLTSFMVSSQSSLLSVGKPAMMSLNKKMSGMASFIRSTKWQNSAIVYSRRISCRTESEPDCTGMCMNACTFGRLRTSMMPSMCCMMYGGLVMPVRSMTPGGRASHTAFSNSTMLVPMSMPYAPMSSEASSIWQTPSAATCLARATISSTVYETTLPRALFVLQKVQLPKQPALIVMISEYLSLRTFGSARDGKSLRFCNNLTVWPLIDSSTTSTILSSCVTSSMLTPSKLSANFLSPEGTQPARTMDLPASCALVTRFIALVSEGCFTVQEFTTQASHSSMLSTKV